MSHDLPPYFGKDDVDDFVNFLDDNINKLKGLVPPPQKKLAKEASNQIMN